MRGATLFRCRLLDIAGPVNVGLGVKGARFTTIILGGAEPGTIQLQDGRLQLLSGREIALFAAQTAEEKKASDIVIYDLRGLTDVTDYFVIATAQSKAQTMAIIESISRDLKAAGTRKMGQEGSEGGQWVLLDYADAVIHVFSPKLREYYGLEALWGDAPKIAWDREPRVALAPAGCE